MARNPNSNTAEPEPTAQSVAPATTLTPETAIMEIGEVKIPWQGTPFSSLFILAERGAAHELQNVVASQVVSRIRKELGHSKANPIVGEDGKAKIKAYREANPEKITEWDTELTAAKVRDITEGTMGRVAITAREPARSPVDNLALAKMRVAVSLAFEKMKVSKQQLGEVFNYKPADMAAKLKEMAANPTVWAKYKAQAEAELAAAGDDELDLGLAA